MMDKVELHPAYQWDCPECGKENFARGVVPEMSEDDLAEMRDDFGVQPWELGQFMLMPEVVQCKHCEFGFETFRMGDDTE